MAQNNKVIKLINYIKINICVYTTFEFINL